MGLGGFLLAGAMKGYGEGKMKELEVRDQTRRDAALAKLRQEENAQQQGFAIAGYEKQGEINNINAANQVARTSAAKLVEINAQGEIDGAIGAAANAAKVADREDRQEFETTVIGINFKNDVALTTQREVATTNRQLGEPIDRRVDENGTLRLFYNDPGSKSGVKIVKITGAKFSPTGGSNEASGSLLETVTPPVKNSTSEPVVSRKSNVIEYDENGNIIRRDKNGNVIK